MDESQSEKLARKMRDAPFLVAGFAGFFGALGYGVYAYRNRGNMSRSIFFVQLRVAAQGMVVGSLCIGVMATMAKRVYKLVTKEEQ